MNLLIGSFRSFVPNILRQRSTKDRAVRGYDAHLGSDGTRIKIGDDLAVN